MVVGLGQVVSDCHVFEDAASATVEYRDRTYVATLRHADRDSDLCSLDVAGLVAPVVTIGTSRLRVGERVYTIGAPQGLELTLAEGILSSRRGDGDYQLLQTTAAISPGSSGGGLFDKAGRLIGITTMFLEKGQQLNFSVPVEWIAELPARHEVNRQTAKSKPTKHDDYDPRLKPPSWRQKRKRRPMPPSRRRWTKRRRQRTQRLARRGRAGTKTGSASAARRRACTETIEISGMRVRVWTIDDYPKPTTLTGTLRVSQTLAQSEFDCETRAMRVTEMTYYDAAGNALMSMREPSGFIKLPRDSVGEARLNDICPYRSQLSGA